VLDAPHDFTGAHDGQGFEPWAFHLDAHGLI
jgi:hypothetical protein